LNARKGLRATGALLILLTAAVNAGAQATADQEVQLTSHEPSTIGLTWDNDDQRFLDFALSLKYELLPKPMRQLGNGDYQLYFAFSARFGQYVGTRDSEPVITKRFNPNLFLRHLGDQSQSESLDFVIGHESNGQSINTPAEYQSARDAAIAAGHPPDDAKDNISRGWDYVGVDWRRIPWRDPGRYRISAQAGVKMFLSRGPFQKSPEEYSSWENDPEGKPRNEVSGLSASFNYYNESFRGALFDGFKAGVRYETGYRNPVRFNTVRLEVGSRFLDLPLVIWVRHGYTSDLAQYYKKGSSVGVAVEIGSF
jgi:hypothetical protein